LKKPRHKRIPTHLTEKEFNEFVFPHLSQGKRGPRPKIALYQIFNYILYVLHTGCQWYKLPIEKTAEGRPEISYSRIFKHFRAWLKKGCFDPALTNEPHEGVQLFATAGVSINKRAK
jgi:transposase